MFFSTRRIPTKWAVIILTVVVIVISGYYWGESQLNYRFTGSKNIPPLSKDLKYMVDFQLSVAATQEGWPQTQGSLKFVNIEDILDVTNRIVADRLEYKYEVSCYDGNVAWKIKRVNCTGYAALQVAILNYIFKEYGLNYRAEWHTGKAYLGNQPLGALAPYLPVAYGGWKGGHAYPVVYATLDPDQSWLPDACFLDLANDGWIVSKEER